MGKLSYLSVQALLLMFCATKKLLLVDLFFKFAGCNKKFEISLVRGGSGR